MTPLRETLELLKENGFVWKREGHDHTIYYNPETKITVPVKRSRFNEDDMRTVLKEAGIKK